MVEISETLESLGFSSTWYVKERTSIAELVPKKGRCGIYVLWFENGEFYVGKTEDVTRRFLDHRRNFNDLVRVSFQKTAKRDLDLVEDNIIGEFERRQQPLRNIAKTSYSPAGSDFELVMSPEEQKAWLNKPSLFRHDGTRTNDPDLRRKYDARFKMLWTKPLIGRAIEVLGQYVDTCVPCPMRSEMSFWGVSSLPSYRGQGITVYSRININWQEVFTVSLQEDELCFSWQVARSSLEAVFGESLESIWERHPEIGYSDFYYKPGGQDQCELAIQSPELALAVLNDNDVTNSMRVMNLRLMNKGPCVYGKYHCFALADQILGNPSGGKGE